MRTITALFTLMFAVCAWGDDQAVTTFSGKGKGGIEVRDASGKVEIVNPSTLRLNQIPADAAEREKLQREKLQAEATELAVRRSEEEAAAEVTAKETAEAEAAKQAEEAAAAQQAAELEEAQHPRKLRRNTVRGTRYVENPPEPKPAAEPVPANTEPVLSISGKKKTVTPAENAAPENTERAPAPPADAPNSAPENP